MHNSHYIFNIDRGGTFTDFYIQEIKGKQIISERYFKQPSQGPEGEGPVAGIRNFFFEKGIMEKQKKIPTSFIQGINLGTTIATNALLERKGVPNTMILTKGFKDLLSIRHQARPDIFDLACKRPDPLCDQVFELNERVYVRDLKQYGDKKHFQRKTGKQNQTIIVNQPTQQQLQQTYQKVKNQQSQSVGISLCNSYSYNGNEKLIQKYLINKGIQNVEIGSQYAHLGYLKRSETVNLDVYLNPIIKDYFKNMSENFDKTINIRIMQSSGGFTTIQNLNASNLLLSGPAGGLISYFKGLVEFQEAAHCHINSLIGLDMGGTSTDVSRVHNRSIDTVYTFECSGIEICTPHLFINTIAAGGGSKLGYYNGMLQVGPESVGSNPGPVCYGMGVELAVTDANLVLNRLDPDYFPKVFGADGHSPLNREKSIAAFEKMMQQLPKTNSGSIYTMAEGFIQVANELMAKSARKLLTLGKPDGLVVFGSAGGQHCCSLAKKIGINKIFIHKYSGILSAYGLSKAPEVSEHKVLLARIVTEELFEYNQFKQEIDGYVKLSSGYTQYEVSIGLGYVGTNYTTLVPLSSNFLQQFESRHKSQNGFVLKTRSFRLQYARILYFKMAIEAIQQKKIYAAQNKQQFLKKEGDVFIQGKFLKIPFYQIEEANNCIIQGPALLLSKTSSILLQPNWRATINGKLTYLQQHYNTIQTKDTISLQCNPIKLTLYSTRLMSIAQQMGKVLQKISISTNIKQRLDFSCGIFDEYGKLLANAPHLPVHLGSMETAVVEQIKRGLRDDQVVLTNHPIAGGSHLPDLTVISTVKIDDKMRLYVASRGHHADIGGISPGSMPPFSKTLDEEGLAVEQFDLVQHEQFRMKQVRELFKDSRRIDDNISDLLAQIAANQVGTKLLKQFIAQYGKEQFQYYNNQICYNAKECVETLLSEFSLQMGLQEIDSVQANQIMDDGTLLKLKLIINRQNHTAIFDFSGTGKQVLGNTNAPTSITRSAVLYCLRSLIGKDIPLNSGCLEPISFLIPEGSILSPSKNSAVVGGNVETSQRIVDLVLKAFGSVACSQGTMNNLLFGNHHISYYETICGGSGAKEGFNGVTTQCHMTNTRITDVQHLEKEYPVIVTTFRKRVGSGGKGRYSGGQGVVREILFLDDLEVSILSERRVHSPYGLNGGEDGAPGKNTYITHQGQQIQLSSKYSLNIKKYESIRIESPGGGGWGIPNSKSKEQLKETHSQH